jgi:hypothetical protein
LIQRINNKKGFYLLTQRTSKIRSCRIVYMVPIRYGALPVDPKIDNMRGFSCLLRGPIILTQMTSKTRAFTC